MRLFSLALFSLSEGQKILTAARQESRHDTSKKTVYPTELTSSSGICGRIQLRPNQPYGIQRPHKNRNGVPASTRNFLKQSGCTDEDMDSLAKEAKKVGVTLIKCRFPRPLNHEEHRDVMYMRCMKNNPLARKSAKHEKIRKKAMKLKCHDGKLNLDRMVRKCERWWDQELESLGIES